MAVGFEGRWRSLAVAVLLCLVATGCQANWVMFGFDAGNSRATTDDSINLVNVRSLANEWIGSAGASIPAAPAVVSGIAYVGAAGQVAAFDTRATAGCTGTPTPCEPLWSGTAGTWVASTPSVVGGKVFAAATDGVEGTEGALVVFDAAGIQGCSGTPKVCTPSWTAALGGPARGSPTVVGGRVYVGSDDGSLYAFDAAGQVGCSGEPLACEPLWTAPTGGVIRNTPAVVGGVVYVGSADANLYAFDAAGTTGCSGAPVTCEPLWRAPASADVIDSPVVVGATVFAASADGTISAFDATPGASCTGTPLTCTARWTAPLGSGVASSVAVAGGRVFAATGAGRLYAIDAAGQAGCGGSPTVCSPLWSSTALGTAVDAPTVVGGVVLVTAGGRVNAFDGAGELGCSGTTSITCAPVWQSPSAPSATTSAIVANGAVYVATSSSLRVYRPQVSTVPVPPVVSAVDAVVGNGEITLRWAPVQRVDLPLSALVLHRFEDGVAKPTTELGISTTQLTLTGLNPSTAYSFRIAVRVGTVVGAPSPWSDVETPSPDVAPASFRIDPGHAGRAVGGLPAQPTASWAVDFPGGTVSHPVYANGRVFVTVARDASGPTGGRLYALDAATGSTLWGPITLGAQLDSASLAYEDHRVYALAAGGVLRAFDEASGEELWSRSLPGASGTPTAQRGVVYGGGYAVDGASGVVLPAIAAGSTSALDGGDLYSVGSGIARRADALTGATIWQVGPAYNDSGTTAVLFGGKLHSLSPLSSGMVRDAATGATVGSFTSRALPAFAGDLRFDLTPDRLLQAVDLSTGQVRWTQEGDGRMASAPIVAGSQVIIASRPGNVFAFDVATGALVWRGLLGASVFDGEGHATVGADRLFVAATGRLVAFG